MKRYFLNKKYIQNKNLIRGDSIKFKFLFIHFMILFLLFSCFLSGSVYLIKKTAVNTIDAYGQVILKNFARTGFDRKSYLEFLKSPTMSNPLYKKLDESLMHFKSNINAMYVYTVRLNKQNNEVLILDTASVAPGNIIRDKPLKIVVKTYKAKKFLHATYINNSWGEYYSFYVPILDDNKNVVSLLGMDLSVDSLNSVMYRNKKNTTSFIMKFSFIIYGISLIMIILSISKLVDPIDSIKNFLGLVSTGNLSEEFEYSKKINEFSLIQNLFIDMIKIIKKILKSIISTSQKIDLTFSDVEQKKTDIITKISDINSLTSQITKSNEKIFSNTNNVKDEIFSFNSSINRMSNEIYNIRSISQNTQRICMENTENIQSFMHEISPLIQKFENFKSNIIILNDLSIEIKHILKDIHEIANQTKLLSLNASIVAASAGEHGDGFAVVAKEIGELSHKTSQSVSHIQDTLGTIIKIIMLISNESISTSNIFTEHTIKSSMFSENLGKINQLILKSSNSLENIADKSKTLTDKNNLILKSIKFIHDESKTNNSILKSILNSTNKLSELSLSFKIEFKKINIYIKNIRESYKMFKIKDKEQEE